MQRLKCFSSRFFFSIKEHRRLSVFSVWQSKRYHKNSKCFCVRSWLFSFLTIIIINKKAIFFLSFKGHEDHILLKRLVMDFKNLIAIYHIFVLFSQNLTYHLNTLSTIFIDEYIINMNIFF